MTVQPSSPVALQSPAPAERSPAEDDLAKALSHPLRLELLRRFNEGVSSPVELARALDVPLGNVSYHVRVLERLGCIELVDTAQRRGAVEHYYRALRRATLNTESWSALPRSVRSSLSSRILEGTIDDICASVESGSFDSLPDRFLAFTPLVLDRQAWDELKTELDALLDRAMTLQAESAGRLHTAPESEQLSRLVLMHYPPATA